MLLRHKTSLYLSSVLGLHCQTIHGFNNKRYLKHSTLHLIRVLSSIEHTAYVKSTEEFIEIMKQHRNIWDPNSPLHNVKSARDISWKEIFQDSDPSYNNLTQKEQRRLGKSISSRWRYIQKSYKEKKDSYEFADHLKFLDGTSKTIEEHNDSVTVSQNQNAEIKSENNTENHFEIKNNGESEDVDADVTIVQEELEEIADVNRQLKPETETGNISDKNDKSKEVKMGEKKYDENKDKRVIAILSHIMEKGMDEDRAFFHSMLTTVKKLNDISKLEFRIKIMELIRNLKEMDSTGLETQFIKSESVECDGYENL